MNGLSLAFAKWLENTSFATSIAGSDWIYPLVQATHFTGLSFWVGTSVAVDLRLIGIGKKSESTSLLRILSRRLNLKNKAIASNAEK